MKGIVTKAAIVLVRLFGGLATEQVQRGGGMSVADIATVQGIGLQAAEAAQEPQNHHIRRHKDKSDGDGKNDFADRVMKEQEDNQVFEPLLLEQRELAIDCNNCCSGSVTSLNCQDAAGPIGDGSCNAYYACTRTSGPIGETSCNNELACYQANTVGTNSCNGDRSCPFASSTIGDKSCNARIACSNIKSSVGTNSCNGESACNPCGVVICRGLQVLVGNKSCNGFAACNCDNPKGRTTVYQIGDGECNRMGEAYTGDKTCCNGEEFPCECTETEGGLVVGTNTCESIKRGFTDGKLKCNSSTCQFDTSECTTCGDGNVEGDEECDGTDLNSKTCTTIDRGFGGGTLKCNSITCQFDTSECTESPSALPSALPSASPSAWPSALPSALPSVSPSALPSAEPSKSPSTEPSTPPSLAPSPAVRVNVFRSIVSVIISVILGILGFIFLAFVGGGSSDSAASVTEYSNSTVRP